MKKINRDTICDHLIEYQFTYIGKTVQEANDNPNWIREWSISQEDYDKFKEYAIPLIKKVFRSGKGRAEKTFAWFDLQFGLRIK